MVGKPFSSGQTIGSSSNLRFHQHGCQLVRLGCHMGFMPIVRSLALGNQLAINALEMQAILLAISHWASPAAGQISVCAL